MAMLKLTLAITKVAIMAQMAMLAISAMAKGVINMAISTGYPVKEHKKNSSVVLDSYQSDLPLTKNF